MWIEADSEQPVGMPLVIQVRIHNKGDQRVSWWCAVGSVLPGASMFTVETKHQKDSEWKVTKATNHEGDEGSGINVELLPGDFMVVPLLVTVRPQSVAGQVLNNPIYVDHVDIRVRWFPAGSESTATKGISIYHDPRLIEMRQFQMIGAIADRSPRTFWNHVASKHADAVVLNEALHLARSENRPTAVAACETLAGQPSLPETFGPELTRIAQKWSARRRLDQAFLSAALATQTETARQMSIDLLHASKDPFDHSAAADALRLSPGDKVWLQRARSEIAKFSAKEPKDERIDGNTILALRWIDYRLAEMDRN